MRVRGYPLRLVAVLVVSLIVGACLPVPLGDPEKAKSRPEFVGAWEWSTDTERNIATIRPFDERTYIVDMMSYTGNLDNPKAGNRNVYKGYLAEVKGHTFLNLQQIETLAPFPGEKREKLFLVCKLTLSSNGNEMTVNPLDGQYEKFKDVGTSTALEKIVTENFEDVKMWDKPIAAKKLGAEHMENLGKLMELFAKSGE